MIFTSVSITLLVILLSLFFLAKVKTESLGSFFKNITYLVLIIATILLFFQIAGGVLRFMHKRSHNIENCDSGMMKRHGGMDCKMQDGMMKCRMEKNCGAVMKCCEEMNMEEDFDSLPGKRMETTTDTIDGKIIKKEVRIIERKK